MRENLRLTPAFPYADNEGIIGNTPSGSFGMSKRFYAARAAMQGLIIAFPRERMVNDGGIGITDYPELIEESYQFADELLKQEQLNQNENETDI